VRHRIVLSAGILSGDRHFHPINFTGQASSSDALARRTPMTSAARFQFCRIHRCRHACRVASRSLQAIGQAQILGTATTPETGSVNIILDGSAGAYATGYIPPEGDYHADAELQGSFTACEALPSNRTQCDPNAQYSFSIPVDFSG
jgi:hypothetical protein